MTQTEELIQKFDLRMKTTYNMAVDYYAAWLWADNDRHRLIGLEWIATKRAMRAEAEVKQLKKQLEELQKLIDKSPPTEAQ